MEKLINLYTSYFLRFGVGDDKVQNYDVDTRHPAHGDTGRKYSTKKNNQALDNNLSSSQLSC